MSGSRAQCRHSISLAAARVRSEECSSKTTLRGSSGNFPENSSGGSMAMASVLMRHESWRCSPARGPATAHHALPDHGAEAAPPVHRPISQIVLSIPIVRSHRAPPRLSGHGPVKPHGSEVLPRPARPHRDCPAQALPATDHSMAPPPPLCDPGWKTFPDCVGQATLHRASARAKHLRHPRRPPRLHRRPTVLTNVSVTPLSGMARSSRSNPVAEPKS